MGSVGKNIPRYDPHPERWTEIRHQQLITPKTVVSCCGVLFVLIFLLMESSRQFKSLRRTTTVTKLKHVTSSLVKILITI